jgi:hypothetical protein
LYTLKFSGSDRASLLTRDEISLACDWVCSRSGVLLGEVRFGDLCFTDEGDEDIAISLSMLASSRMPSAIYDQIAEDVDSV